MNILLNAAQTAAYVLLAVCIIPIAVLMIYAIVRTVINHKKQNRQLQDEAKKSEDLTQRELFARVFGGGDNIIAIQRNLGRVSVTVRNLDDVLSEELKELSAGGVLLVDNIVKCSFGDRAEYIQRLLEDVKNNEQR